MWWFWASPSWSSPAVSPLLRLPLLLQVSSRARMPVSPHVGLCLFRSSSSWFARSDLFRRLLLETVEPFPVQLLSSRLFLKRWSVSATVGFVELIVCFLSLSLFF